MKKIIKLFPIVLLLIIFIFVVFIKDTNDKSQYNNFDAFDMIGINLDDSDVLNISQKQIDQIYNLAIENNVLLVKTIYNKETNSIDNYISTNNIIDLYAKKFNISNSDKNAIVTYKNSDSSAYYKTDFLNNHRYGFYSIQELKNKNLYRYGTYSLYYQNEIDKFNFLDQVAKLLNASQQQLINPNFGKIQVHIDILYIGLILATLLCSLFYFVIVLFLFYRDSKKIGVLALLGFDKLKIFKLLNLKSIFLICIFSIGICILSLLLPNVDKHFIISLILINIIIIVLTIFVLYLALVIVIKYTNLSDILKKRNLVKRISQVCFIAKFIIISLLFLFVVNILPLVNESLKLANFLADNDLLMDYAVFPRIRVENDDYDDQNKFLNFYKEVIKQNIDHIYVHFNDYLITDTNLSQELAESENNGISFRMASVDKNYLKKYALNYYDNQFKAFQIDNINQEFYLLPVSKKHLYDALKSKIKDRYQNYNLEYEVLVYFYDDIIFDTYDSEKGIKTVQSPIIRVIDENYPYTYIQKPHGLSIAGINMNTALKFKVTNYNQLKDCIQKVGLANVLTEDNFVTYQNYFADKISLSHKTNSIFVSGLVVGIIFYLILIIQTFVLYIESMKNKLLVKVILGFSKKDIFIDLILWHIATTIIPIIGYLTYSTLSLSNNLLLVFIIGVCFIFIELVILLLISNFIKLNNVYTKIKGE